jgi:hypothetical protein
MKEADKKLFPDNPHGSHDKPSKISSFFKTLKTFCLHPTVWRLAILGLAVATTIITAGAIIPVITLVATAFTALISVVGKTIQHRSLERAKLHNGLTKVIEKREKDVQALRKSHARVFSVLEKDATKQNLHEITNVQPEHRGWSIARVLGFIGLEQFWTVSLFATAANPVGIAVYAAGLALGTLVVKSEYDYRVLEEQEKSRLKKETNERCKMLGIAKYANDKELYQQFEDRMIYYKTVEMLCKEDTSRLSAEEISKKFEEIRTNVKSQMTFKNIPKEVSLGSNLFNAINPFKDENSVRTFDIDFDEDKLHFEMRSGYEKINTSARHKTQNHDVSGVLSNQELARAQHQLHGVSTRDKTPENASTEDVSHKLRDAVKRNFVDDEQKRRRTEKTTTARSYDK